MGIQECENCGTKFNYIDLQKSFWSGYKPITCRNCGARHLWKMPYRIIIASIMGLPLIYLLTSPPSRIRVLPDMIYYYVIYMLYVVAVSGLCPFVVRYDLEDKWK